MFAVWAVGELLHRMSDWIEEATQLVRDLERAGDAAELTAELLTDLRVEALDLVVAMVRADRLRHRLPAVSAERGLAIVR